MSDDDDQAEHARIFGEVSKRMMLETVAVLASRETLLTPLDWARIHIGVGVFLAEPVVGRSGAVAMLRELADSLDRGENPARPN